MSDGAIVPANQKIRYDEKGKPICGAIRRDGMPCRGAPMENGRCKMHGGKSLRGIEHPNYKHGKASRYLPAGLVEKFEAIMADPDYVRQREQIAILDIMLMEQLTDWSEGGGGNIFVKLQQKREEYYDARSRTDTKAMVAITNAVMDLIGSGYAKTMAAKEVRDTMEQRRKLTESERKLMIEERTMIPAPIVVLLMRRIGESIAEHVTDEMQRRSVLDDITKAYGTLQQRAYAYHNRTIDPMEDEQGFEGAV